MVTGAGRGIRRAICARYIEEGAFVFVTDIDEGRARSVATEPGQQTAAPRLDVTSQELIDGMITAVVAQRNRLDI